MSKIAPGLALGLLVALLVASTVAVPVGGPRPDNSAVVTTEVKSLDASLSRLKSHVDAGRVQDAKAELSRIEKLWLAMKPGLGLRNLAGAPSDVAFDDALASARAAPLEDRSAAGQAQKALAASFSRVKADLQSTTVVDLGRLSLTVVALLVVLVSLAVAIPRLSDRMSLAQ